MGTIYHSPNTKTLGSGELKHWHLVSGRASENAKLEVLRRNKSPKCLFRILLPPTSSFQCAWRALSPSNSQTQGCHTPSGLSVDFQPQRAGTLSHATLPTAGILPLSLFFSSFLPFSLPLNTAFLLSARLYVCSHAKVTHGEIKGGWIICHFFSFVFMAFCLADFFFFSFFSPPVSTQAGFLEPSSNFALLGWCGRGKPCPLNSQPPCLLHQPSNPGRPAPAGRGELGTIAEI